MSLVWKLGGVAILLIFAFVAGYMVRAQSCLSRPPVARTETPTPTTTSLPLAISATQPPPPLLSPVPTRAPETELVFSNYNSAGVASGPTSPTVFTTTSSRKIYLIQDYHWNGAQGKSPGTIALKSAAGKEFGPWQAEGAPGQGGVPDAYWTVYPSIEIPAGTYTIVDSHPASWAQNAGTKGVGMSQVYALK